MIFISGLKLIYIRFLSTGNIGTKKEEYNEISRSIHFDSILLSCRIVRVKIIDQLGRRRRGTKSRLTRDRSGGSGVRPF